jgi:hypothetical protein
VSDTAPSPLVEREESDISRTFLARHRATHDPAARPDAWRERDKLP